MSVQHFKRTVWSAAIMKSLATISSLRNHCDFTYEKDANNAEAVKILSVNRPTIRPYVKGEDLILEDASDNSVMLNLDQAHYYNVCNHHIDKVQSTPGMLEAVCEEAAKGMTEVADKYVAQIIKADVESGKPTVCVSANEVEVTSANVVDAVEDGFAALYENNCPVNEAYYLELAPRVFTAFRKAMTELSTNNPELLKKGAVGKYGNAYVCIDNLLPQSETANYNLLRTQKAIAFAEQINEVIAYKPEKAFSDAVKALYVFGAKIVRPKEIYVMKTKKAAA